jgi:N-acetylglucosamine-6-phosphate deacetylase
MPFALSGATIHADGRLQDGMAVLVTDGIIDGLAPELAIPEEYEVVRLPGGFLVAGFVDLQVNGGGGVLLNDTPTAAGVRGIADAHAAFGTTGMLPTVITDRPEVTWAAVDAVRQARAEGAASVLGIHVEGPFIDLSRKGAHPPECIRDLAPEDFEHLARAARGPESCGAVLLTLSPAHVSPATIEKLVAAGVTVSLGHSEASADQAVAALAAGASGFTHLFNAMSQLSHRSPGMVGAALAEPSAYCGVIADGYHVDPLALRVAVAAKPADRLVLVSDAMPPAAGGPDRFALQGRAVERRDGRLVLADGTLAGSNLTMDEAVRFAVQRLGVPLVTALSMASAHPAAWIGLGHMTGRIAPRLRADLVLLGRDLGVRRVWVAGRSL